MTKTVSQSQLHKFTGKECLVSRIPFSVNQIASIAIVSANNSKSINSISKDLNPSGLSTNGIASKWPKLSITAIQLLGLRYNLNDLLKSIVICSSFSNT